MNIVGIDSCRSGWFVVAVDQNRAWEFEVFPDIGCLWQTYHESKLLLIDIPIGLPASGSRICDVEASSLLRKRASSVFPAPSREAIQAHNYREACQINQTILGKKLSIQAWNISHKIKDVDDFLLNNREARNRIRESHPEVCFWALAGGKPMQFNKKTAEGIQERLNLLQTIFPGAGKIFYAPVKKYKRTELARDDILDALCLAITAASPSRTLVTIPPNPPRDVHLLPMEIVYSNQNLNIPRV